MIQNHAILNLTRVSECPAVVTPVACDQPCHLPAGCLGHCAPAVASLLRRNGWVDRTKCPVSAWRQSLTGQSS